MILTSHSYTKKLLNWFMHLWHQKKEENKSCISMSMKAMQTLGGLAQRTVLVTNHLLYPQLCQNLWHLFSTAVFSGSINNSTGLIFHSGTSDQQCCLSQLLICSARNPISLFCICHKNDLPYHTKFGKIPKAIIILLENLPRCWRDFSITGDA